MKKLLMALGIAVLLAGCGTTRIIEQQTVTRTVTRVVTDTVATAGAGRFTFQRERGGSTCTIQLDGYDAVAWFGSPILDVGPACAAVTDLGAAMGNTWVEAPADVAITPSGKPGVLVGGDTIVCEMVDTHGVAAFVWDSGGQDYGRQLCENLAADDWKPLSSG